MFYCRTNNHCHIKTQDNAQCNLLYSFENSTLTANDCVQVYIHLVMKRIIKSFNGEIVKGCETNPLTLLLIKEILRLLNHALWTMSGGHYAHGCREYSTCEVDLMLYPTPSRHAVMPCLMDRLPINKSSWSTVLLFHFRWEGAPSLPTLMSKSKSSMRSFHFRRQTKTILAKSDVQVVQEKF